MFVLKYIVITPITKRSLQNTVPGAIKVVLKRDYELEPGCKILGSLEATATEISSGK